MAIEDNVGNISNEISQTNKNLKAMKTSQKTNNDALKNAVEDHSQVLEGKVLQLGNEVNSLKSDFKKSHDVHEESSKSLKSELKKSQDLHEESPRKLQNLEEMLSNFISHLGEDRKKSEEFKNEVNSSISRLENNMRKSESDMWQSDKKGGM